MVDEGFVPPGVHDTLQRSAVSAIAAKAGNQLPVFHGKADPSLAKMKPVLDISELREKNQDRLRQRAERGDLSRV